MHSQAASAKRGGSNSATGTCAFGRSRVLLFLVVPFRRRGTRAAARSGLAVDGRSADVHQYCTLRFPVARWRRGRASACACVPYQQDQPGHRSLLGLANQPADKCDPVPVAVQWMQPCCAFSFFFLYCCVKVSPVRLLNLAM